MALRPEAWKGAILDAPGRALRTKADCSECRASGFEVRKVDAARVEADREAMLLVGAAAKACLSMVERAIEAISARNGWCKSWKCSWVGALRFTCPWLI
jgi:hypothetical protein